VVLLAADFAVVFGSGFEEFVAAVDGEITRSLVACMASAPRGLKPEAIFRFCWSTASDSMPLIVVETDRLMAYDKPS
jgi:hypothetical protein